MNKCKSNLNVINQNIKENSLEVPRSSSIRCINKSRSFSQYQPHIESEKLKNILFCSISHELRSPANHINGMLELLRDSVKDDHLQNFIKIAISSVNMMIHKIDDILDYSMLENESLEFKFAPFDVRALLFKLEEILSHQYDKNNIKFSIFISDSVPQSIIFDERRLEQVILNLAFNALKYTEKGFVTIIVDLVKQDESKGVKMVNKARNTKQCTLSFSVSDSGCGIEKKKRMNLFELFSDANQTCYNTDDDILKSSRLMGMGLTYCHRILKKMGTKLTLTSAIKVGSTFSFEIKTEYETNQVQDIGNQSMRNDIEG